LTKTRAKGKARDKSWFIETSVLIKSLMGDSLTKKEIRKKVSGLDKWSSHYVLMEYKRSIIKTLIEIFYVAKEEENPSDVLSVYSEKFGRKTKTALSFISALLRESDLENDKDKFLLKIETYIELAVNHFDSFIDYYIDNITKCPLGKADIEHGYSKFLIDIECQTNCKVENLWSKSRGKSPAKAFNSCTCVCASSRFSHYSHQKLPHEFSLEWN